MQMDPNNVFELSLFLQNAFHFIENCEMDLSIRRQTQNLKAIQRFNFYKQNKKRKQEKKAVHTNASIT